jgi:hypothetical protein
MAETKKRKTPTKAVKSEKKDKDETLASQTETSDVDALVAADKAESTPEAKPAAAAQPSAEAASQPAVKPEASDQTQAVLEQSAADAPAQEIQAEAQSQASSQTAMNKNVYLPIPAFEAGKTCEEQVEAARLKFALGMKKTRVFSTVIMAVLIVGLVGGFLMNSYLPSDLKWLVYVLFGILIVLVAAAMIVSSRQRKKLNTDVDAYVDTVLSTVDSYVFTDPEFTSPVYAKHGNIDLSMVVQAHYYDTINTINSRNVVKTQFMGQELTVSEVACQVPYQIPSDGLDHSKEDPKKAPSASYGIFGKYVTYPLTLASGVSVIFLMKGAHACLPTFTDGYQELKVEGLNDNFLVWATDETNGRAMFTPEVLTILNSWKSDANMENIFFSVNASGLKISLGYNESVMEVPMEKPVAGTPYQHYKSDIEKVLNLIKALQGQGK